MRDAVTPPMGWNSWNTFTDQISEDLILETADAMVSEGLLEAGYRYLVIDDCWSLKLRDKNGLLVPDPDKFPHGMKYIGDYLHERGLKFGMYSCCGVKTCAGYPGSFEHEFSDAEQFASWGVDYLKYDNCFKPTEIRGEILYRRMGMALSNCGRDIVFSACQWGRDDVHTWIRSTGADLFRSTDDIRDSWESIRSIALSQLEKMPFGGNFCHNDMDMLVVGLNGAGGNEYISAGGCSAEEYQSHFALWCMMNSPLMAGCDVRKMDDAAKAILLNKELIAINQDAECRSCYVISDFGEDAFILVKPLAGGDYAAGFFNLSDREAALRLTLWDMGLSERFGRALAARNCLSHENEGLIEDELVRVLSPHACAVYRLGIVKNH